MQKERKICFPESGKLKIMQVSDPQDMHIVRSAMTKMLDKVYDAEKPDLVVFTGDNILGNHLNDYIVGKRTHKSRKLTERRIKKALDYILKPLDKRKIPYCMLYGNHDDMNALTKQEQAEYYKAHEYFFGLNSDDSSVECDTYNVPIYDSKGEKVIYNLYLLDSAGHPENGEDYSGIKKETVDWYIKKSNELKEMNGGEPVPSLMFQHIPVKETVKLFTECEKDDPLALRANEEGTEFVKLDKEKANGFAFEYPAVCDFNDGELEAIRQQNDVCALVFGHDHMNSFTAELDGVNIVQTSAASFRCYGNTITRSVRIFEIDESNTSQFQTRTVGYFDLFGKGFIPVMRYIMSADEKEKTRNIIWILLAVFGVAFVVYILGSFHFLGM